MFRATGFSAFSKKIIDEWEKKKESRQGALNVGPSDVAKKASDGQTSRTADAGDVPIGIVRASTVIQYEDPSEIQAEVPLETESPREDDISETQGGQQTTRTDDPSLLDMASMSLASPHLTPKPSIDHLPYYSPSIGSSNPHETHSVHAQDETHRPSLTSTRCLSTSSAPNTIDTAIRIKTNGATLTSGFPYTSALFDLKIHPEKWTAFTTQVIAAAKVAPADTAKVWAAATATALAGHLAYTMNRAYQEKRVRAGMGDMSAAGLGTKLREWNEAYFEPRGLFVALELSESALKREERATRAVRKPALFYASREERERKEGERKFVVVVRTLEALARCEVAGEVPVAEMPGDTYQGFGVAELPGDEGLGIAELGDGGSSGEEKVVRGAGVCAELDSGESTRDMPMETVEVGVVSPTKDFAESKLVRRKKVPKAAT